MDSNSSPNRGDEGRGGGRTGEPVLDMKRGEEGSVNVTPAECSGTRTSTVIEDSPSPDLYGSWRRWLEKYERAGGLGLALNAVTRKSSQESRCLGSPARDGSLSVVK